MTQSKKSKLKQPVNLSQSVVESQWQTHAFLALGTQWSVDLPSDLSQLRQQELLTNVTTRLAAFDLAYSRFRADSIVSQMSVKTGMYEFPADFPPMWQLYEQLTELSGGLFTPFIGSVLSAAGYDATYSLVTKQLTVPPGWEAVSYRQPFLTVHQPILFDFGAGGKGYAIDLVAQVLLADGVERFFIDAGGDIIHHDDTQPIKVGLENPLNTSQAIGIATIQNRSICGSAGNRRQWGKFHHLINPVTLKSPQHILATWVVADTTMLADALSTCLFFTSPAILREKFTFEYAVVHADQSLTYSDGFPAEFF